MPPSIDRRARTRVSRGVCRHRRSARGSVPATDVDVPLNRVEAMAPAFPVEVTEEASLGLVQRRQERCNVKASSSVSGCAASFARGLEQALLLDNGARDFDETKIALTRRALQTAEGVLLGEVERRHQQPLGALDDLSILERLLRAIDLGLERLELGVPCRGESECGLQLACVDRLGQICADAA